MEGKKIPYWWAAWIGLVFPILQILLFFLRFRRFNDLASVLDYVMFFVAGAVGGLLLIFFLRRSKSRTARWIVFVAYLLATPVAIAGMVGGGLLGAIGILMFSFVPWVIFLIVGYFAGGFFPK